MSHPLTAEGTERYAEGFAEIPITVWKEIQRPSSHPGKSPEAQRRKGIY